MSGKLNGARDDDSVNMESRYDGHEQWHVLGGHLSTLISFVLWL